MGLRDRLRAVIGRAPSRADAPRPAPASPADIGGRPPRAPVAPPPRLLAFPAPRPFSPDEALALHPIPLDQGRPSPASLPLDRPLLVVAADELDAAAFAEVLAAHGASVVRYRAAAAPAPALPRSPA